MFKKIISLFVSYSLICSAMLCVTANSDEFTFTKVDKLPQPDTINYSHNEKVMFIVEVEGEPLLSDNTIATFGGDFLQSRVKKMMTEEILANQAEIIDNIQEEIPEISEPDYVYTALFNGFAIEGERSDEEKLLSIPGVKNVYISGEIEANPKLTDSIGLSHALPDEISDYTGEGQAIAIIDNEFDCSHRMFSQAPQNPKYTRDDIENLLPSLSIKPKATVDTVYKSEKIPFAFNYISENGNTYSSTLCHGTHVAGIAAGNNGNNIRGVAPDAQLVLMKVAKANGGMPEYAILQALNDAALLGVRAINCSFGFDYMSVNSVSSAWQTSVDNAKTAGIYISAAASNSAKGFYGDEVLTENIDYSATAVPATVRSVTSVASANNLSATYAYSTAVLFNGDSIKLMQYYINQNFYSLIGADGIDCVDCGYGLESDFNSDLTGKIALIRRGKANFSDMSARAKKAGAVGFIIINSADEYNAFSSQELPCALVRSSDGEKLIKSGKIVSATPFLKNIEVSSFSSYCVDETLELKPDITAPGGNIYSSVPSNKYDTLSGTSMAAPHITGIVALMNEYFDKTEYSGSKNRIDYINNMLLSTATVLKYTDTDIPYSPRVQGAGLVNVASALNTPVILYGNTGATKISLMDNLTKEIELNFTAESISDFDAVYDNITVDVLTDSYKTINGKNVVDTTKRLTAEIDAPESITVVSGQTENVTVSITLDESELSENLEIFTNGFFIEGFIHLESSQENIPSIGIPFMGFYGNWTKAPVFDKTIYDDGGSLLIDHDNNVLGTLLTTENSTDVYTALGFGISDSGKLEYIKDFIAISPNGDNISDNLNLFLTPMRTIKNAKIKFSGKNLTRPISIPVMGYMNKFYTSVFSLSYAATLPDGDYYITVTGEYNYNSKNATTHSFTLPFYVDRVKPQITNATLDDGKVSVICSDSKHINNITIELPGDNYYVCNIPPKETGKTIQSIFTPKEDITFTPSDVWITVTDDAGNSSITSCLAGNVQPKISLFEYNEAVYKLNMDIIDSQIEDSCSVILSFYDETGHLLSTELKENITLSTGNTLTFTQNSNVSDASTCKLFIWDNISNLSNIDISREFSICSYMNK